VSAALVDASALIAAFGVRQRDGKRYQALFRQAAQENWSLASTWPCIVEASHMLEVPGRYAMLKWVAEGAIEVFPIAQESLDELADLMMRYTDRPRTEMDLADASLVWLAVDTGVTTIMTLDARDFARYRLSDGRAFEIL
jgi:uncharacterized protein